MHLTLRPRRLKRYRDIGRVLLKYWRSELVPQAGLAELFDGSAESVDGPAASAEDLTRDLERLGPTFIKLGQFLSTRVDLLPSPYVTALARLQDHVEPFPFADVERIVHAELGVRVGRAFAEFDPNPVAAASLGQVHRAVLRDGRKVAVKVQRPDIRLQVAEDLELLEDVAGFLEAHTTAGPRYSLVKAVTELRRSLLRELDYRREAEHLVALKRNLRTFRRLVVPGPIEDYSTSRVLTMEYVAGAKITALSPVVLLEVNGAALAEDLFRAYLKQILVDGLFHADPHPGNILLTDDGRLALLDLGMVARVTPRVQDHLLQLLMAVSEGRADHVADGAIKLGGDPADLDVRAFTRDIADIVDRSRHARVADLMPGRLVLDVTRVAAAHGVPLPPELTMLGKTLLNLDEVARRLDPEFDPNAAVRRHGSAVLQRRLVKTLSPGSVFSGVLETKELLERLPERLNQILDRLARNDIRFRVDAIDQVRLMAAFQKVANRITLGLVLAALVVGAALLMRVETSFRILGYPGLAIIFFVLAALGGLALIATILLDDE